QVPTRFYVLRKKARKYTKQLVAGVMAAIVLMGLGLLLYAKVISEQTRRQIAEEQTELQAVELALKSKNLSWAELRLKILGSDKQEAEAALNLIQDAYVTAENKVSQLNHRLGTGKPHVPRRPIVMEHGQPLTPTSLVRKPAIPHGTTSWTLETRGHRFPIYKLMYSPNGNQLASTDTMGAARIWDADSGQLTDILLDPNDVASLAWFVGGYDSDRFWIADDGVADTAHDAVTRWNITLPGIGQSWLRSATALALSPDRDMMALGFRNGMIQVVNLKSGQLPYACRPTGCGPVDALAFSSDGKFMATDSGSGTICLWDARNWQPLRKFTADSLANTGRTRSATLSWGSQDTFLTRLNVHGDTLEVVDTRSGQLWRNLHIDRQQITTASWEPGGTLVAAGTMEDTVHVWDVTADVNELELTWSAHTGRVGAVVWKPENQNLITAGQDGRIRLWDARGGKLIANLEAHTDPIESLALSPDGNALAFTDSQGAVCLWNFDVGRISKRCTYASPDAEANKSMPIAWSSGGKRLAFADSAGVIHIWDPNLQRSSRSFASGCGTIHSLGWSPDDRILVGGGIDGTVRAWDVRHDYQEHVVLLPLWDSEETGIAIGTTGDYRGSTEVADQLVYVVKTMDTNTTLRPADFQSQYGWVNEPWQVGLYQSNAEKVERIYVDAACAEPGDGKTWATAFCDLQEALSLAQPGTEIWVAAGTYTPDRGTRIRTVSFYLRNGVRLLGGFDGTETNVYQRDPNLNETFLSGDLMGDDGPDFINRDDNSYHVIMVKDADPNALLDGFTIAGGHAWGQVEPGYRGPEERGHRSGGGMLIIGVSPTIQNCVFKNNSALRYGGGVFTRFGNRSRISNCTFLDNSAGAGGGMTVSPGSRTVLVNCRFYGNVAIARIVDGRHYTYGDGGGLYHNESSVKLTNCQFVKNTAENGGGLYSYNHTKLRVTNCRFIENSASYGGGANNDYSTSIVYTDSLFVANTASSCGGGMVNTRASKPTATRCEFVGNSANLGGGIANDRPSMIVLDNCILSGNRAQNGGGMWNRAPWEHPDPNILLYEDSKLVNCTFSRNYAEENGGGFWNSDKSSPEIINSIFWGNHDHNGTTETAQIYNFSSSKLAVLSHCCIEGWTDQLPGINCLGDDPLFVDSDGPDNRVGSEDDDLSLRLESPCVDAGDTSALPTDIYDQDGDGDVNEVVPYDLYQQPRIRRLHVDIGAFEVQR
ncbi:hypothetical protein ACFL6U_31495, partial [Planctomycetota bacterium]